MKKSDWKILLICAVIGVVTAVVTGRHLYQGRHELVQAQARIAFGNALQDYLQKKWKDVDVFVSSPDGYKRLPNDSLDIKKEPVKVTLVSEYGEKVFEVPYEKFSRNIEKTDKSLRMMHSYLLHASPLNADSLNLFWKERLAEKKLPETTGVRIAVSDWEERVSCTYAGDALYTSQSDSLSSYYIGGRCEVGVTGYLYTPWWVVLSWKDMVLLAVLIAAAILLFFIYKYVSRAYRRLSAQEKSVVIEKEVPVIIEKHIPAVVSQKMNPPVYQLEEGVYFDTDSRLLKGKNDIEKVAPLPARLLKALLDAEDYKLSNDEIMRLLWQDDTGTLDKLYQTVKRLRESLSKISVCTIECESFTYYLKIPSTENREEAKNPHFIEENPA